MQSPLGKLYCIGKGLGMERIPCKAVPAGLTHYIGMLHIYFILHCTWIDIFHGIQKFLQAVINIARILLQVTVEISKTPYLYNVLHSVARQFSSTTLASKDSHLSFIFPLKLLHSKTYLIILPSHNELVKPNAK